MNILIAEDESITRMGLKSMLQEMGHVVFAARNGKDAIQQARNKRPDLAILDIRMPLTDGLDAAKAIYRHRPIPILMATAHSDAQLIERASSLPIQGYLIKPVDVAELKAAIAVATKRFDDQQNEVSRREKAEEKLETRILVDRAKGVLMDMGLSEEDAFKQIQKIARDKRTDMRVVAQAILKQSKGG